MIFLTWPSSTLPANALRCGVVVFWLVSRMGLSNVPERTCLRIDFCSAAEAASLPAATSFKSHLQIRWSGVRCSVAPPEQDTVWLSVAPQPDLFDGSRSIQVSNRRVLRRMPAIKVSWAFMIYIRVATWLQIAGENHPYICRHFRVNGLTLTCLICSS